MIETILSLIILAESLIILALLASIQTKLTEINYRLKNKTNVK